MRRESELIENQKEEEERVFNNSLFGNSLEKTWILSG